MTASPEPLEVWLCRFRFLDAPRVKKVRPAVILEVDEGALVAVAVKVTSHAPRDEPGEFEVADLAHGAARLFAGDAKTDERDAAVIAKTALGIPDSLLPVPKHGERLEAARSMAAQRSHMVTCSTRDKNRLRSILLESCPAFEALT